MLPGTPAWLTPVVQVTTQFGVPTVFAAVLLWFVLTRVGGTLDQMQKADDDRVKILAAMQDNLITTLDRQTKTFEVALDRQTTAFEKAIRDNIEANRAIAGQLDRRPRDRD